MDQITWDDFQKVQIRVGTIVKVEDFPKARKPAYILTIDFGAELGIRRSSAQITNYAPEDLLNRQILAVVNCPPKQIANFFSECLTTGVHNEIGEVILVSPLSKVPNGAALC